jgi:hypothetical protein
MTCFNIAYFLKVGVHGIEGEADAMTLELTES